MRRRSVLTTILALFLLSSCRSANVLSSLAPAVDVEGRAPVRWTLDEELTKYKVPGVSIAVVDRGRIVWSCGRGVLQAGGKEPVTAHTLFQAASISKPVSAMAALRAVQDGSFSLESMS